MLNAIIFVDKRMKNLIEPLADKENYILWDS